MALTPQAGNGVRGSRKCISACLLSLATVKQATGDPAPAFIGATLLWTCSNLSACAFTGWIQPLHRGVTRQVPTVLTITIQLFTDRAPLPLPLLTGPWWMLTP